MKLDNICHKKVLGSAIRDALYRQSAFIGVPLAIASTAFSIGAIAQNNDPSVTEDGSEVMEEVIVRGTVSLRYKEAFSATKMNTPIKDIAQSITVITEDLLEMGGVKKFQDLYRVDASVGTSNRPDDFPTNFFRGFTIQGVNAIRIDGFRFPGNVELDLATFERFEIVKGPTSALFGQNSLGGTLNAVSKLPGRENIGEVGLEYGSNSTYRVDLDLGGELAHDGKIQYRFITNYRDSDTHIDSSSESGYVLAPSLAYDVTDNTRLVATVNYTNNEDSTHWGTGLQMYELGQYRVLPADRRANFGQPWNQRDTEAIFGTIRVEHDINNDWHVRANLQASSVDKTADQCSADGHPDINGVLEAGCWTYHADESNELFGAEVNLIGPVELFGQEHTIFIGADYTNLKSESRFGYDYIDDNNDGLADHGGNGIGFRISPQPTALHEKFERSDLYYVSDSQSDVVYAGLTLQAQINPTENLQILLSGRYTFDEVKEVRFRAGTIPEINELPWFSVDSRKLSTKEFIPQVGVTYTVNDDVNIYFNYGETYNPEASYLRSFNPDNPAGDQLDPEKGEQYEVGIKADLFDDKASFTFAAFDMLRSGIYGPDKLNPGFFETIGTQEVKGVELVVNGSITDAIDVYWSAAYLDAEYTKGDFGGGDIAPAGSRPVNTPEYASSLFVNYSFQSEKLKGLGVGVGWVYKDMYAGWGRVFTALDGSGGVTYDFGDISEVDISLNYEKGPWSYYLSATNIFDDTYYSPVRAEYRWGVNVNAGRWITAGVRYNVD